MIVRANREEFQYRSIRLEVVVSSEFTRNGLSRVVKALGDDKVPDGKVVIYEVNVIKL